jgi:PAS domain S-box-containing protein
MGCNKAFEEYVGLTQQELLGRRPHDLWPAELADNYLQQDLAMFSNPGMQSYETSVRHADGAVRDVIFNKATFAEKDGSVAGLVCVIQDITEYKRTEDEKLRLESQLAYARLMETIMIRLGHDLKTPLTPLFILLPLLKKQLADPEQIKKIETCIKSAASIKSLADKTGILARLSYGSEGQHKTFFPLASLVDQAIKDCSQQISYKQICCQNLIDPALKLHGVQGQFNELFNNLISNAAVFSNEHGSITISALCDTSKVLISVRDKGIGIAPDHLDDVFDEFFKADESRHNLGASGLGLSICKRIVQNHHGRIWAESPGPGQGTTINIRINNDASDHRPTGKESAQ